MIPLKCETGRTGFPFATVLVVLMCVVVHMGRVGFLEFDTQFTPVGLMQALVNPERGIGEMALALLLAMFTHASLIHLVANMWFLWLFGVALEQSAGFLLFLTTYLVCGVASMLVQAFSNPYSGIPIVGASGAIAGVMGALLVLRPFCKTIMWIPPFFFVRIPAFLFLGLWIVMQYLGLRQDSVARQSSVAWWAHIGGFAAGILVALEMRRRAWVIGPGVRNRRVSKTAKEQNAR